MSKLLVNTNGLTNYVLPKVNDSIDELISAISLAESLDIPYGFNYRTYLNNLSSSIRREKNNCIVVKDFVATSISSFNNNTSDINDMFSRIDNFTIKERNSIIK